MTQKDINIVAGHGKTFIVAASYPVPCYMGQQSRYLNVLFFCYLFFFLFFFFLFALVSFSNCLFIYVYIIDKQRVHVLVH